MLDHQTRVDNERVDAERRRELTPKALRHGKFSHCSVEIPTGALFYPCCGRDLNAPLRLFRNYVSEFHFVDIDRIPPLPNGLLDSECESQPPQNYRVSDDTERRLLVLRSRLYGGACRSVEAPKVVRHIWTTGSNKKIPINAYKHDGLTAFLDMSSISVFYLRGDSCGEGGSGQFWFQPQLFDLILEKLVDGGLIVTDGSGKPSHGTEYLPWRELWRCLHGDNENEESSPLLSDFDYNDRHFKCITQCGYKYGPVYAWQVIKIQK